MGRLLHKGRLLTALPRFPSVAARQQQCILSWSTSLASLLHPVPLPGGGSSYSILSAHVLVVSPIVWRRNRMWWSGGHERPWRTNAEPADARCGRVSLICGWLVVWIYLSNCRERESSGRGVHVYRVLRRACSHSATGARGGLFMRLLSLVDDT